MYYVFKQVSKSDFLQDFKIALFIYNIHSFHRGIKTTRTESLLYLMSAGFNLSKG